METPVETAFEETRRAGGRRPVASSDAFEVSNTSRSMAHRNAASVFPEPVGAEMSVDSPAMMRGHACFCAGDAPSKRRANHSRVAGWNARPVREALDSDLSPTIRRT